MNADFTVGDIYEGISERLAEARTRALMGERQEALGLFQGASLEFTRFREILHGYPGYHALEHAFRATMTALCLEQEADWESLQNVPVAASKTKTKRRLPKAA